MTARNVIGNAQVANWMSQRLFGRVEPKFKSKINTVIPQDRRVRGSTTATNFTAKMEVRETGNERRVCICPFS
jgi:hypothetical protein